jgi:hypothetical protein
VARLCVLVLTQVAKLKLRRMLFAVGQPDNWPEHHFQVRSLGVLSHCIASHRIASHRMASLRDALIAFG